MIQRRQNCRSRQPATEWRRAAEALQLQPVCVFVAHLIVPNSGSLTPRATEVRLTGLARDHPAS
jgi:hypothetical protein